MTKHDDRMAELARALDVPPEVLGIPAANHWSALQPVSGRRWGKTARGAAITAMWRDEIIHRPHDHGTLEREWAAYTPPGGTAGTPLPTALLPRPSQEWLAEFRAHLDEEARSCVRVPCPDFGDDCPDWTHGYRSRLPLVFAAASNLVAARAIPATSRMAYIPLVKVAIVRSEYL